MNTVAHLLSWLRCKWPIVALLLVSGALNFYHLDWGLPNGATSWAYDALTPMGPLRMGHLIVKGQFWFSRYPAGHHVLLLAVNAPYIAYLYLTGEFRGLTEDYPYGLKDPERSLTVLFLADRAVSAIMGVGIVLLLYLIGRRRFGELAGLFSAAAIALNVIFIYHSHTTNVDIPYLFWMMLALYFFDRALESGELRHFVLLSLFAAVSLCTKESVVGVLAGMVIPLVWVVLRERRWKGRGIVGVVRAIADRRLLIGLATFLTAFGLIGCAVPGVGYWFAKLLWVSPQFEIGGALPQSGEGFKDFSILSRAAGEISQSFGTPLSIALWFGAVWVLFKLRSSAWPYLLPAACYYLVFQRNWLFLGHRFAMPQMVFLALLGGPLVAYLIQGRIASADTEGHPQANRILRLAPIRAIFCTVIAGIFGYTVLHAATLPWLLSHDSRYAAEGWLRKNTQPGQTVEILFEMSCPRTPQWMTVFKAEEMKDKTPETVAAKVAARGSDFVVVPGGSLVPERYPQDFGERMVPAVRWLMAPLVKALESGALGYERAAMFKTRPFFNIPLSHDTINPLIVIYKRTASGPHALNPS